MEIGRSPKANAPSGIGWWVWYMSQALQGRSIEEFAKVCRNNGITHLFIKAGDGATIWPQFAAVVTPLRSCGLRVYGWGYNYGEDPDGEAKVTSEALRAGADGYVFDIEGECEGRAENIERMWQIVRKEYPAAWLGYAPLPIIDYHDPSLYAVSNRYADAVLPQFYWGALGAKWGNLKELFARWERWAQTWKAEGIPVPDLLPVGQAYDSVTPSEIAQFVELCQAQRIKATSFWEWVGSTKDQWAAVMEAAKTWDTAKGAANNVKPPHRYELGFAAFVTAHPDIGAADSELRSDKWGNVYQDSTKGLLVWKRKANEIEFIQG